MAYQITKTSGGIILHNEGRIDSRLYEIAPGVILGFHKVKSESLPLMDTGSMKCLMTINHARKGICELKTEEGNYIYLKGGSLCISGEWASSDFHYPAGKYEGIEIYIFDGFQQDSTGLLQKFQIDFDPICSNYIDENHGSFITDKADALQPVIDSIYSLFDKDAPDLALLQLYTLLILRMLTAAFPSILPMHVSALTPSQLAMAKKTHQYITDHLDQRIPIRSLAEEMGISETSLKNYFRAVYGQNISEYLLNQRMEKAKVLLAETNISISEIAALSAYQNPSRFDSAFQKYTGCTPSAWRKRKGC